MSLVRVLMQFAVVAILTSALAPPAIEAIPVQGPSGHYYEFVPGSFTWPAARAAALGTSHLGQQGYLAVVTSSAEEAFLATLAPIGWLGGTDQATEGVWLWADGPEANQNFWNGGAGGSAPGGVYTNWGLAQPDNGGIQNFLLRGPGGWDDFGGTQPYYVEFNSPVPGPATLLLLGTAAAGLGLARWRQRRQDKQR